MIENMTTEMWIGLIAFLAGLVFVFGAAFRKNVGWKINPMWSAVAGVCLILIGGAVGVAPLWKDAMGETDEANIINVDSGTTQPASYSVTPSEGTAVTGGASVTIASDERSAQILLYTVASDNAELTENYTALNFTLNPVAPTGSNANDLTTVYFETPYDMKHDGEYVLSESSGEYYANWTYAAGDNSEATSHYKDSMTMLLTETGWAEVDYKFDSGTSDCFSAELDETGESLNWDITFHNADWSWSETFTVNVMYMGDA